MNCKDFKERSYEFAAGELSMEECRIMKEHMEKCEECKREYELCAKLVRDLKSLSEVEAPKGLVSNVMDEISNLEKKPKLLSRVNTVTKFGTAAAAAVIILAGTVALSPIIKQDIQISNMEELGHDLENAQADEEIMPEVAAAGESKEEAAQDYDEFAQSGITAKQIDRTDTESKNVKTEDQSFAVNSSEEKSVMKNEKAEPKIEDSQNQEQDFEKKASGSAASTQDNNIGRSAFSSNDEAAANEETEQAMQTNAEAQSDSLEEAAEDFSGIASFSLYNNTITGKVGGGSRQRYVQMITEFVVSAEYKEAVLAINTENKTSGQIENELGSLEIPFEVNIRDKDYTEEYAFADENRKAEIEALCEKEICTIITKEVGENEDRSTEQGF